MTFFAHPDKWYDWFFFIKYLLSAIIEQSAIFHWIIIDVILLTHADICMYS